MLGCVCYYLVAVDMWTWMAHELDGSWPSVLLEGERAFEYCILVQFSRCGD